MHANLSFIFFIHHIWGERVLRGAVFIIQTSNNNAVFHILSRQIAFIQYFRTIEAHVDLYLAKPFKKFPKSPIRPAGSNFWQAPNLGRNFKRVTLQRDEEFIESIFFDTLGILSTPASDVYERLKTNDKAMKISLLRLPTINKEI